MTRPASPVFSWSDLVSAGGRDLGVWICLVGVLGALRWILIVTQVNGAAAQDMLLALGMGARFDAVIAGLIVTPTVVLAHVAVATGFRLGLDHIRIVITRAAAVLLAVIYGLDFAFFKEFGCRLDSRLLALRDDPRALATTIWTAHHPLPILAAIALLAIVMNYGMDRCGRFCSGLFSGLNRIKRWPVRLVLLVAATVMLVYSVRGLTLDETPIRIRNAFVTGSLRINRTIPSPIAAFLHDLDDRTLLHPHLSSDENHAALNVWRHGLGLHPASKPTTVTEGLRRTTRGATHPPRHLFVIVLEGQHGFPLLPQYRALELHPGLSELATAGTYFTRFLPAGRATNNTLASLMAGLLMSANVLHEPSSSSPYATALAPHFKRLGYRTRFYYGGYLGWSRLEQFATGQGFSEVHGGGNIKTGSGNAWGYWDEFLYAHVLETVDTATASLNVILTTTNHSPYNLDASRRRPLPDAAGWSKTWDPTTRNVLQHERYADQAVAAFVAEARRRYPEALFVITGDHVAGAARFDLAYDPVFAGISVPLVLLGEGLPRSYAGEQVAPGSHLDLAPTLYELCAPAGFHYTSLGSDLFSTNRPPFALGQGWVAGRKFIASTDDSTTSWHGSVESNDAENATTGRSRLKAVETLSIAALRAQAPPSAAPPARHP